MPRKPKPHSLTLTPADVRAAKGRDERVVFLPVTPEPTSPAVLAPEVMWVRGVPTCIWPCEATLEDGTRPDLFAVCPLGPIGREVLGKEAWCQKVEDGYFVYNAEGNLDPSCFHYKADGYEVLKSDGDGGTEYTKAGRAASPWMSAARMPLWASRFRWTVSAVSVVRIQDVGDTDAFAYGIQSYVDSTRGRQTDGTARGAFREMWSARYSPEQWQRNVWCWRVGLKGKS